MAKEPTKKEILESVKELAEKAGINLEITPSLIKKIASNPKTIKDAIPLLAKYFLKKKSIITFSDTDEIFVYESGAYIGRGDKILAKESQKILENHTSIHFINEMLGHIRRSTFTSRDDVSEPENKICLDNGILNLDTLIIEDHNPSDIFFNKLPVKYSKKADCKKIKKFFVEIFSREEDKRVVQELLGYCLYKRYNIQKAFLFVGGGANGKSTLIRVIKTFLGNENCSSVPLQQLETDKFAVANLFGKLVNMFADLPSRALKETSLFKMLTGEDQVPAEKKFKDKFFFDNYAKMIFSANQIPKSPDDSDAFFRRWVIIMFPNQFLTDKADKHLISKLTTKGELSGLLNFAIEGLKRLLEQGDFSHTKTIEEIRENYIRQSDSVAAFIMDAMEVKHDGHLEKKKLYTTYTDYCRKLNYPAHPENTFHRELQKKIRVEDYRPRINNQRVQCWLGISLNSDYSPDMGDLNDISDKNKGQKSQGGQGKLPLN